MDKKPPSDREIIKLTLRDCAPQRPETPPVEQRLRRALKFLLRACDFRVVNIEDGKSET